MTRLTRTLVSWKSTKPFERQLSKGVTEKGSRIEKKWITDDDPLTVYTNEGRIVVQDTGYSEYPIGIEIYDDYRE